MKGKKHKTDFLFYHNALSLMKAKEFKKWMDENGILKKWLLPVTNLNTKTPYFGHPVGNSPEMMPLDTSLF